MEIFSYILAGTLAHKDSMGNGRELRPGQIQLMSAGSGVTHSEYNPSKTETLHFLQIWIQPEAHGIAPSYTEWSANEEAENASKVLVISANGREGSAVIHQDADVYRLRLLAGEAVSHHLGEMRGLWLQMITGELKTGDIILLAGDALSQESAGVMHFTATEDTEALLFDLA